MRSNPMWLRVNNHFINLDQIVDIQTDGERMNHGKPYDNKKQSWPVEPCVVFVRAVDCGEYASVGNEIVFFEPERTQIVHWLTTVLAGDEDGNSIFTEAQPYWADERIDQLVAEMYEVADGRARPDLFRGAFDTIENSYISKFGISLPLIYTDAQIRDVADEMFRGGKQVEPVVIATALKVFRDDCERAAKGELTQA